MLSADVLPDDDGEEFDRFRGDVLQDVRETLTAWVEAYGQISFPGGSIVDHLREEVARLETLQPRARAAKRRLSARLRKRIFERDGYRCVSCGGWHDLTIDHRVPESRGGTDDEDNLQTMCASCNSKKGTAIE